ncbi:MAG: uracil-DNA glycosylase [Candidatus Sericytochromatia bacterium]|nr:uracil-DNA glycosylase [Candidatus Sericytochromatia bacterium]
MADPQLNLFAADEPAPARPTRLPPVQLPPHPVAPVADVLASGAATCNVCQLCDLNQPGTKAVYGSGQPHAKIMLIGEAPGAQEDATGLPFVGPAGQLLTKIFTSVGLDRERDVYITNVAKHRPPGNRVPTPDEIAACKPYLLEQIEAIDPPIILLAGATALKAVLDRTGITRLRGEWIQHDGRWYMPIFHPSFLLRNASRDVGGPKWLTWQDMQKIRQRYDAITQQLGQG